MTSLGKLIARATRPPEEVRSENLRTWASTIEGMTPIAEVKPRTRARVAGVVQNVRIDPREGSGSIEATIIDGTGHMVAKWLGRPQMSGISLGMGLILSGIVGVGEDKEPMILNPEYELVPGPEHG